jgi:hypothetical protein
MIAIHAEPISTSMTEPIYLAWIPALSGMLRFGDHVGVTDSGSIRILSEDTDLVTAHLIGHENKRQINVALWVTHTDEDFSTRKQKDTVLKNTVRDLNQSTQTDELDAESRDRDVLYVFKLGGKSTWISDEQDEEVSGTWTALSAVCYKRETYLEFTELDSALNVDDHSFASGALRLSRSGFSAISLKKQIGERDEDDLINQVYYALKHIFHRHKYHNNDSDGLLKAYSIPDASVLALPTDSRHFSRIAMKLYKQLNSLLKNGETREQLRALKGYLAYLNGYEISLAVYATRNTIKADKTQEMAFELLIERLKASQNAYEKAILAFEEGINTKSAFRSTFTTLSIATVAIVASIFQIYQSSEPIKELGEAFTEVSQAITFKLIPNNTSITMLWLLILVLVPIVLNVLVSRFVTLTSGTGGYPAVVSGAITRWQISRESKKKEES